MKQLLFILLLTIGNLCFAKEILRYEILQPAKNPLPKDVKTVLFVYRNIDFSTDSITQYYMYNNKVFRDTTNYKKKMVVSVYRGFVQQLQKHYPTDTINFTVLSQTSAHAKHPIPLLTWKEVNQHCAVYKSDVVVSLEDISLLNNYHTWQEDSWVGLTDITSYYKWRVYDPMTQRILVDTLKLDTIQSEERSYSLEYLLEEKMPRRGEIAEIVSFSIGQEMAQTLIPHWIEVERFYYERGSSELRRGANWMHQEKWSNAINEYQKVTEKPKSKARAYYNMAVVYERMGNIEKALEAVAESVQYYAKDKRFVDEQKTTIAYKNILLQRQKALKKLKAQTAN